MDERQGPGCRRIIIGTLIVVVLMTACVVTVTLGLDGTCVADLEPRLPIYPGATVTLQQHNFLRQFGMGESVMILHTDDSEQVVRDWYGRTIGALNAGSQGTSVRHLGQTTWTVGRAEDGKGSQIILYGKCGS